MDVYVGIALVILSIGISVFLIGFTGYSILIHRKRIEVRPSQTNFNSNNSCKD